VLLLAFDTATPAVTVAVHDGTRVLAHATTVDARRQGELLASHIQKVLAQAGAALPELTVVVAGAGPGPYTGLRTGLVTARVLGSALGIAVHGVCTLDVIACDAVAAAAGRPFLVATDARRREVYWARYSAAGERLSGPGVASPASLPAGFPTAGEGPVIHPGLGEPIGPRFPSAATLAGLAAGWLTAGPAAGPPAVGPVTAVEPPEEGLTVPGGLLPPEPLYLRRPDARPPGPAKSVLAAPDRAPRAGSGVSPA
jgi:tRNA threonylcarbamoyl adenosine modification protein YeaZ